MFYLPVRLFYPVCLLKLGDLPPSGLFQPVLLLDTVEFWFSTNVRNYVSETLGHIRLAIF